MSTKKDLEKKVEEKIEEVGKMKIEVEFLRQEYKMLTNFMGTLGYTMQEIYRCYPHVIAECCTEKDLIRIFKVQLELTDFIREIQKLKQKEDEESGFDEI